MESKSFKYVFRCIISRHSGVDYTVCLVGTNVFIDVRHEDCIEVNHGEYVDVYVESVDFIWDDVFMGVGCTDSVLDNIYWKDFTTFNIIHIEKVH